MSTLTSNFSFNIPSENVPNASSVYRNRMDLSGNNIKHILSISAYGYLGKNWDSYNAEQPSKEAIVKANDFIAYKLSTRSLEVFYTTPTPDGDILVELKNENCSLEFIFSAVVEENKIVASCNGDFHMEHPINDTTFASCLRWLHNL